MDGHLEQSIPPLVPHSTLTAAHNWTEDGGGYGSACLPWQTRRYRAAFHRSSRPCPSSAGVRAQGWHRPPALPRDFVPPTCIAQPSCGRRLLPTHGTRVRAVPLPPPQGPGAAPAAEGVPLNWQWVGKVNDGGDGLCGGSHGADLGVLRAPTVAAPGLGSEGRRVVSLPHRSNPPEGGWEQDPGQEAAEPRGSLPPAPLAALPVQPLSPGALIMAVPRPR